MSLSSQFLFLFVSKRLHHITPQGRGPRFPFPEAVEGWDRLRPHSHCCSRCVAARVLISHGGIAVHVISHHPLTEAIPSAVCIPHPFIPVSPWPVELYPCATTACIPMAAGTLSRIPLLTKSHKILLGKSKVLYAPPRTYHIGLHWREALCHFACDFLLQKSQQVTHGGSPISPPPH